MESIGIICFTYLVLPKLNAIEIVLLMPSLAILPSLGKLHHF